MDCVRCGQQYEVGEQGCKPVKLDSGEVVFTDVMNLYTCKNDECELHDQTFTVHTFEKYTVAELLARYSKVQS